jgi:uncharacterized membrane protein
VTKSQTTSSQNKQIIMEIIKTEQPQTTQELIKLTQQKTSLNQKDIEKLIIQLENENKLKFTKKQTTIPTAVAKYTLSTNASWYWITIALATATAITVFTVPEDAYPIIYLRNVLGVIFVLFLPGYAFIKLLFPWNVPIQTGNENLDRIERIALSFGMSLALTPIVGLILNYTPLGIRVAPITLSLLALTAVFATAAVIREHQIRVNTQPQNAKIENST